MTLLHQAAQKAVEAPPLAKRLQQFRKEHYTHWTAEENQLVVDCFHALSALQQQPEPAATVTVETLRQHWLHAMECDHAAGRDKPHCACSLVDLGWHPSVGAAVEVWLAHVSGVSPALQHQEVPREPVALNDGVPDAEAAMAYALKRWGYKQGTGACIAFYRGACWLQLAASPSTTRQQEDGNV